MHNFTGTAIGMVHIMLPFMVLPLYASMRAINPDYMRAAANLGASPVKAFWQVFVPLAMPGLAAGVGHRVRAVRWASTSRRHCSAAGAS